MSGLGFRGQRQCIRAGAAIEEAHEPVRTDLHTRVDAHGVGDTAKAVGLPGTDEVGDGVLGDSTRVPAGDVVGADVDQVSDIAADVALTGAD